MPRNKGSLVFVFFLMIVIVVVTFIGIYDVFVIFRTQTEVSQTYFDLREIGVASLGMFLQFRRIEEPRLWKKLGGIRKDFWGQNYVRRGKGRDSRWGSSGPDKVFDTDDDIWLSISKLSRSLPAMGFTRKTENTNPSKSAE